MNALKPCLLQGAGRYMSRTQGASSQSDDVVTPLPGPGSGADGLCTPGSIHEFVVMYWCNLVINRNERAIWPRAHI